MNAKTIDDTGRDTDSVHQGGDVSLQSEFRSESDLDSSDVGSNSCTECGSGSSFTELQGGNIHSVCTEHDCVGTKEDNVQPDSSEISYGTQGGNVENAGQQDRYSTGNASDANGYTEFVATIAVYGTLKQGYGNHRLLDGATFLGGDFIPFNCLTGSGFPIAKFEGADGSKLLKVEIYGITTQSMLSNIDALEGHPNWYRRTPVKTATGKLVEIYDMFSRTFDDNSEQWRIKDTSNMYEWNSLRSSFC